MTSKIDIREIVTDHLSTFKDEGTGKVSLTDYIVMVGIPAIVAIAALALGFSISDRHIGTLISVFSIFAGLLFNVLVLIYSFSDSKTVKNKSLRDKLLSQSFANISYSIVASLLIVFLLTILIFVDGYVQKFFEGIAIAVTINFFLSLLMVLKRMHVLLKDKFTN